jgi:hypothetical protein
MFYIGRISIIALLIIILVLLNNCAGNQDDSPQRRQEHLLTCGPAIKIYESHNIGIKMCTTIDAVDKEPNSIYVVIQGAL